MLITWDYDQSVARVSAKVAEWKAVTIKKSTLTDEIARDLYEAREQLDARGGYRHGEKSNVTNVTTDSWNKYLSDVGLQRMTVHRWLEHFDPAEQRLLTDEEYTTREAAKARLKMAQDQAIKNRVDERIRTGVIPKDWDDASEKKYKTALEEQERTRLWREKINSETEERKQRVSESRFQEATKILGDLSDNLIGQERRTKEFAEKARLTGDNAGHDFNKVLIDYLSSLSSDGERLEACHNIIKICRQYVNKYQVASVT